MSELASPNGLVADSRAAANQSVGDMIDAQAQLEGVSVPEPVVEITSPDGITTQATGDTSTGGATGASGIAQQITSQLDSTDPTYDAAHSAGGVTGGGEIAKTAAQYADAAQNNDIDNARNSNAIARQLAYASNSSDVSGVINSQNRDFDFVGGSKDYAHFAKIIIDVKMDELTQLVADATKNLIGSVGTARITLPMDNSQELTEALSVSFSRSMDSAAANFLMNAAGAAAAKALNSTAAGVVGSIIRRTKVKYDSSSLAKRLNIPFVVYVNDRDTFQKLKKCISFLEALLYPVGPALIEIPPPVSVTIGKLYTSFVGNLAGINIRYENAWTTEEDNSAFMVEDSFPLFIRGTLDFVNLELYMWSGVVDNLNLANDTDILFGTQVTKVSLSSNSNNSVANGWAGEGTEGETAPIVGGGNNEGQELKSEKSKEEENAPASKDGAKTDPTPDPAKDDSEKENLEEEEKKDEEEDKKVEEKQEEQDKKEEYQESDEGKKAREAEEAEASKRTEELLEEDRKNIENSKEADKETEAYIDKLEKEGNTEEAAQERKELKKTQERRKRIEKYKAERRAEFESHKENDGYDNQRREVFESHLNEEAEERESGARIMIPAGVLEEEDSEETIKLKKERRKRK